MLGLTYSFYICEFRVSFCSCQRAQRRTLSLTMIFAFAFVFAVIYAIGVSRRQHLSTFISFHMACSIFPLICHNKAAYKRVATQMRHATRPHTHAHTHSHTYTRNFFQSLDSVFGPQVVNVYH